MVVKGFLSPYPCPALPYIGAATQPFWSYPFARLCITACAPAVGACWKQDMWWWDNQEILYVNKDTEKHSRHNPHNCVEFAKAFCHLRGLVRRGFRL